MTSRELYMQKHTFSKTSRWRNAQFAGQYLRMIQIAREMYVVFSSRDYLFRRRSAIIAYTGSLNKPYNGTVFSNNLSVVNIGR